MCHQTWTYHTATYEKVLHRHARPERYHGTLVVWQQNLDKGALNELL